MILSRNDKFLGAILYKKRDFLEPCFVQETENVGLLKLRKEDPVNLIFNRLSGFPNAHFLNGLTKQHYLLLTSV